MHMSRLCVLILILACSVPCHAETATVGATTIVNNIAVLGFDRNGQIRVTGRDNCSIDETCSTAPDGAMVCEKIVNC